jgi:hypothetical protein
MTRRFQPGERVRIVHPSHEYTGARGTIVDSGQSDGADVVVLGYDVAVDGENGLTRPFLAADLEPLRAARAGVRSVGGGRMSAGEGEGTRES